jgi:hypothetical protein
MAWLRWASVAAALALALVVCWFALRPSKLRSLAVLPFVNSGGEDLRYLSDGLTDNVINNVSKLPSLRIISRAAVFALRDRTGMPEQIGKRLGVDAILTGTVSKDGDALNVSVELSDVRSNPRISPRASAAWFTPPPLTSAMSRSHIRRIAKPTNSISRAASSGIKGQGTA